MLDSSLDIPGSRTRITMGKQPMHPQPRLRDRPHPGLQIRAAKPFPQALKTLRPQE